MTERKQDIQAAREAVAELVGYEKLTAKSAWRIADLTARNTKSHGNDKVSRGNLDSLSKWAEEIGWLDAGRAVSSLQIMTTEARAWPDDLRVDDATFWQHYEVRKQDKDVETASLKLRALTAASLPVTPPRPRSEDGKLTAGAIKRGLADLPAEQREAVIHDIAKSEAFAAAVKADPVLRDEVAIAVDATRNTPEQAEAKKRDRRVESGGFVGWNEIGKENGQANYHLTKTLEILVQMAIAGNTLELGKNVANILDTSGFEALGRTIYEIEAALVQTPVSDKIAQLREKAAENLTDMSEYEL